MGQSTSVEYTRRPSESLSCHCEPFRESVRDSEGGDDKADDDVGCLSPPGNGSGGPPTLSPTGDSKGPNDPGKADILIAAAAAQNKMATRPKPR